MAGQIIISNIKTDSDNAFSILANTGAVLFSANLASGITTGIADGSVTNAKLAGSITGNKIATGQITGNLIATGQITGNLIATGQITGNLLTANCVSGNNIVSSPTITGNVTINGSLGIGGATTPSSGVGIKFPGTQVASTDANTLDDYEEGTWTPTLFGSGGSAGSQAYTLQVGRYVKIGRYVFLSGYLQISNKGSWTGDVNIGGFPFTIDNESASYSATTFYNAQMVLPASNFGAGCYPVPSSVTARMFSQSNSGSTNLGDYANQITNNTQIGAFTICYYASA